MTLKDYIEIFFAGIGVGMLVTAMGLMIIAFWKRK